MVTCNADSLTDAISGITDENAEKYLNLAINRITAHGYEISILTGTAGSMTATVTQAELGWIQAVAIAIYAKEIKNSGSGSSSVSIPGYSASDSSATGAGIGDPDELAESAATKLSKTEESDYSRAFI